VVSGQQILHLSFDTTSITVTLLLHTLVSAYPRIEAYLFDSSTQVLHPEIRMLLNGERLHHGVALTTPLYDNDRLTLLITPSVSDH
jgi:hypothetical protein